MLENRLLLCAALLPAIILLVYVYSKDKVEKEPLRLILRLFGFGALAGPIAMVLESILIGTFETISPNGIVLLVLEFFIGVALVEEGLKYLFLSTIRKNPEFNYVFDGVVYAVAVTLGFATLENILYVFTYGWNTALMRALLSVPGHCAYGVIMGCFFGMARHREIAGNASEAKTYYWLALILPVIAHGFFDAGISSGSAALALLSLGFQVAVIIAAMILVHKLSIIDKAIGSHTVQPTVSPQGQTPSQAYVPQQPQVPQQQAPMPQQPQPQQPQVPQQYHQTQAQAQVQRNPYAQPAQIQTPQQQWQTPPQQPQVPQQQAPMPQQPQPQQNPMPMQAPQPPQPQQPQVPQQQAPMPQQYQPQQNPMPMQTPQQTQTPQQQWQTPPQQR